MRAALYARISQDEHGTEKGVQRQLEDARALAESRGWDVVGEWLDNDVSAYSGAKRQGYEDLMAAATRGEFDRIVVYMTSRLWRGRRERADAMDVLADKRISVAAVSGPELDLSTASGRLVANILGEFDTAESAIKGERVARAALQRAREGRASGPVLYGWQRERILDEHGKPTSFRDVEHPAQAKVVRELTQRILGGESLKGIAEDFNRRQIPTPSGRTGVAWQSGTVRKLALRPANVALRVHHGTIMGEAAWPAIVDGQDFEQAKALLEDPDRRYGAAPKNDREHLLTYGVGRCGVCGSVLRVVRRSRRRKRTDDQVTHVLYVCDVQGCVGRDKSRVDDLVDAVVVERLSRPDAADLWKPIPEPDAAGARKLADDLRRRLDDAAEDYAEGIIDRQQMARITELLAPQLADAEREVGTPARLPDLSHLAKLFHDNPAEAWGGLDVERKRRVLEVLGLQVAIMPTRQGPGFRPDDVTIEWGLP